MLSPNICVSDENPTSTIQKSCRKSVGRTPLKDLTPQNMAEPNCITKRRSSSTLSSCLNHSTSRLHLKEQHGFNTGTPVNIWVETAPEAFSSGCVENDVHSSRNLQHRSDSGTLIRENTENASAVNLDLKHTDHFSQLSSTDCPSQTQSSATEVQDHTYCNPSLCTDSSANNLASLEKDTGSSLLEVDGCHHTVILTEEPPNSDVQDGDFIHCEHYIDNCLQLPFTTHSLDEPNSLINPCSAGNTYLNLEEIAHKDTVLTKDVLTPNLPKGGIHNTFEHGSLQLSDISEDLRPMPLTSLYLISEQNEGLSSQLADCSELDKSQDGVALHGKQIPLIISLSQVEDFVCPSHDSMTLSYGINVIANETMEIVPCPSATVEQIVGQSFLEPSASSFTAVSLNKLCITDEHKMCSKKEPDCDNVHSDTCIPYNEAFSTDHINSCQSLQDCGESVLNVEKATYNTFHIQTDVKIDGLFGESSLNDSSRRDIQNESLVEQMCHVQSNGLNVPEEEVYISDLDTNLLSNSGVLKTKEFCTAYETSSMLSGFTDSIVYTRDDMNTSVLPTDAEPICLEQTFNICNIGETISLADAPAIIPLFSLNEIRQVTPFSTSQKQENSAFNMRAIQRMTPKLLCSPLEIGTCMTPTSNTSAATWTTPIMLLNKSLNTSWDFAGKGEGNSKDNASETDSLLWNFSKESFHDASKEELMNRLEGALIVIEVLSRQLQGWQQGHPLNSFSRPSEQRETSTQTYVTYSNVEEQYYHNLYINTKLRLEAKHRSNEEEEQLKQMIRDANVTLDSHLAESASLISFAEKLYEIVQKDKADINQKMSQARTLLADHVTLLRKMEVKMEGNILQKEKMREQMESALCTKEAADQCLRDLELHYSTVIAQLQRDQESERQLCEAVRKTYEQQFSYNEVLVEFAKQAQTRCSKVEDAQSLVQAQCSQAKELMTQHWRLFEVMKKKTEIALLEHEAMKSERDRVFLENEKFGDMTSKIDQLTVENTRLGSEMASLMEHLCKLETKIDQHKEENSEQAEELAAKDSSLKLLEKELNEATIRGQEIRQENKQLSDALADVVPRLEQSLSATEQQKRAFQVQMQEMERQHATQLAVYTESLEFLEQENSVCREQVAETESQLKTNLFALRERNLLCETQKDTIRDLQRVYEELQEELQNTKCEARDMLLKMGKEISDSSLEVSQIKASLLDMMEQMRGALQGEPVGSKSVPQTPARHLALCNSIVGSVQKNQYEESKTESVRKGGSIFSETSAFCKVQPITSPTSGEVEESLPEILRELSHMVSDFTASSSQVLETKAQEIQNLNKEISALKDELRNSRFENNSDIRHMKEEMEKLRLKNQTLDESLTSKQQCIRQLEEIVHQQEEKLLQQLSLEKDREEMFREHSKLKRSVQMYENEAKILKEELAKNCTEAARDWIQEKLLLHQDLTKLRLMLLDTENSKTEIVNRAMRHRNILEGNLTRSDMELRKLDDVLEKIRGILLSIPEVVSNCEQLRQVMEYLN
ncbi:sperm-associated antigen 5 [Discoglossus pictus]